MKFTELYVEGSRCLVNISLPLRPLTVMIGPNGSGKTALLEVFQLLRDASQEKLASAIERAGGLNAILPRIAAGPERLKIGLTIDAQSSHITEPMHYQFELAPRNVGYIIPFEHFSWLLDANQSTPYYYIKADDENIFYADPQNKLGFVRPTWNYHEDELALAQVPRMYAEPEAVRSTLANTRFFSFLDVRHRAVVRLPQALVPTSHPGPNGENLYSALYNLRSLYPDVYDRIIDVLQIGFPNFHRLEFPVVGAGQITMTWYQDDLTAPLYPNELSEGTLRFLWLTTILLSPDLAPITLIDEPEVSLHPELLKLLAGLLQDAAMRGQVIVATHAPDLIRWLEPNEILVLDKTDSQTEVTWADTFDLDEWLRDYTLAELWLMGTLGGRP